MESLKTLFSKFEAELSAVYDKREARQITEILFEDAGYKKKLLVSNPNNLIPSNLEKILVAQFEEVLKGKPVNYVTGKAYFLDMVLNVTPAVLIPRPETEELVMNTRNFIEETFNQTKSLKIIDIGTGSGCISIALKKKFPFSEITAIDKSNKALTVATQNAKLHHVEINFLQLDFLGKGRTLFSKKWDVIISNPPYVDPIDKTFMKSNVLKHEPHEALFPESDDVLIFYKKIAKLASITLNDNGFVIVEIHENHGGNVRDIFSSHKLKNIRLINDLQDKNRIVCGYKN